MKLIKVSATNFRAFEQMDLDLQNRGLVLVQGSLPQQDEGSSNGASKSSLYYAILYALYGKLPDGTSGDSVINNKVGKGTKVVLSFENQKHTYRVERYRKHKDNKNKVLLFQDEQEITLPSNKETDAKIVELVGMNLDTMLNSLVFGSNNMVSFVNATDKQRKEMLEQLTGIQVYQKAQDYVKEDAKLDTARLSKNEEDLSSIITRIGSNNALESTYEASMGSYESTKQSYENKLKELGKIQDTTDLNQQKQNLTSQVSSKTQEKNQIVLKANPAQSQLSRVSAQMSDIKYRFNNDKKTMQDLAKQIREIQTAPEAYCKLCGSLLNEEHKKQELSNLAQQGKQVKQEYQTLLEQDAPKVKKQYDDLTKQMQEVQQYNDSIMQQRNQVDSEIQQVQKQLNQVNQTIQNTQNNNQTIQWTQQQLANLQRPAKPKIESPDKLAKQKQEIEDNIETLTTRQNQLKQLDKIFGLQGIKSHVLGLMLPFVNKQLDHYMNTLTDGNFTAQITTKSTTKSGSVNEKMSIEITAQNAGDNYKDLSTGEKRRVDLAISLSLQDYLLSKVPNTNFNVFDEVFDGLDGNGMENVMKILQERAKHVGTILVISHSPELKEMFENTITVEKIDGISKVK